MLILFHSADNEEPRFGASGRVVVEKRGDEGEVPGFGEQVREGGGGLVHVLQEPAAHALAGGNLEKMPGRLQVASVERSNRNAVTS